MTTTNEGAPNVPAAAANAEAGAGAPPVPAGGPDSGGAEAPAAGAPAAGTSGTGDTAGTQPDKPAGEAATPDPAKPDGEAPKPDDKPVELTGAPEAYTDWTVPEGMALDPEITPLFKDFAKTANLSQAGSQKAIDLAVALQNRTIEGIQAAHVERVGQWAEQAKVDPLIGGKDYDANITTALAAVAKFGDPELKTLFEEFGLGNNPALVRAFYRIGKSMGEGGFVHGQGAEHPAPKVHRDQALADRIAAEQARGK